MVPCLALSVEQQSYDNRRKFKIPGNKSTRGIKVELKVPTYAPLIPPMRLKC